MTNAEIFSGNRKTDDSTTLAVTPSAGQTRTKAELLELIADVDSEIQEETARIAQLQSERAKYTAEMARIS